MYLYSIYNVIRIGSAKEQEMKDLADVVGSLTNIPMRGLFYIVTEDLELKKAAESQIIDAQFLSIEVPTNVIVQGSPNILDLDHQARDE